MIKLIAHLIEVEKGVALYIRMDNPKTRSRREVGKYYTSEELKNLGIDIGALAKAVPLQILNDVLAELGDSL